VKDFKNVKWEFVWDGWNLMEMMSHMKFPAVSRIFQKIQAATINER